MHNNRFREVNGYDLLNTISKDCHHCQVITCVQYASNIKADKNN